MNTPSTPELQAFHRFLGEKLSHGATDLSPEEALDEWRQTCTREEASAEDLAAIQEALNDVAKGDNGMLFEDFDREFRERHQLPAKP